MDNVTFSIPRLWADHHVLAVRGLLQSIEGIDGVEASSARKQVKINFDAAKVSLAAIKEKLVAAGYVPTE